MGNEDLPKFYNVNVQDRGYGNYGVSVSEDNTATFVLILVGAIFAAFAFPIILPLWMLWVTRNFILFLLSIPVGFGLLVGAIFLSSKLNWNNFPSQMQPDSDWFMFYLQLAVAVVAFAILLLIAWGLLKVLGGIWSFFANL